MRDIAIALFAVVVACASPTPEETPPDASPTCTSTVIETCGPRPMRPSIPSEVWEHDIDLWAKCAEWAVPR